MEIYQEAEDELRGLLAMLEELENTPLADSLESEVASPLRNAFSALLPDSAVNVDTARSAFAEFTNQHDTGNHGEED